nr:ROK family protein [Psychromonas sp. SA13A]
MGRRGQPAISLKLNPDALYTLGVSIERDNISIALLNFCGEVLNSATIEIMYPSPEQALDYVSSTVADMKTKLSANADRIKGCGIAISSLMGALEHGDVPKQFNTWQNIDVKAYFIGCVGCPIVVERVATVATIAENFFGYGKVTSNFIYLYTGLYFGGGIILNGELYRGSNGRAGDMALSSVNDNGKLRNLVDCCSLQDLQEVLSVSNGDTDVNLTDLSSIDDRQRELIEYWVDDAARKLAPILITAISVLDINTIVVGGRLPQFINQMICDRVNLSVDKHFSIHHHPCKLVAGEWLDHLTALGAAILPLYDTFSTRDASFSKR